MLFYAIPLSLSGDKENMKSLGSSVASDIRDDNTKGNYARVNFQGKRKRRER
jgi:hypothetical protein